MMDQARGASAGLMAGRRQPEEMVFIIFASSLPSRLPPRSSAPGCRRPSNTRTHPRLHSDEAPFQVASPCLYADEGGSAYRQKKKKKKKAAHILNSLDKLRERCFVNAAELCKSVNKHTHEIRAVFR